MPEKTRSELSEVVLLYTSKIDDPLSFTYEVECVTFQQCNITLNFEGSENFAIKGKSGLVLTASIRPFTRVEVGTLYLVSDDKRASLKMGCEWQMAPPAAKDLAAFIQKNNALVKSVIEEVESLSFPQDELDPDDEEVHQICDNYGKKFTDVEFLPTITSLFKPDTKLSPGEMSGTAPTKRSSVVWRRASDFMEGEYAVFEGGIDPADIRQGALGDCWFLCAIAALTEFPKLITDLVETKEANSHGCYRVRFCKNGMWQSVRVDDFFPCFPGAGPVYSRSNGNELWVMLLEKAYSKLHGSYEAIKSGWAYEGMMDMTGAPCTTIRFDDSTVTPKIKNGQLWRDLMFYDSENYVMSASTPGEDTFTETGNRPGKDGSGLVAGHAYTLIAAKQSVKGHRLVKLRNPWGSLEWNGDWSDSSPLWTEEMQEEIERISQEDDGMFWMSFEDMLKNFYAINVCMVRHEGYHPRPWIEHRSRFHYDYDLDELTPESHRVNVPMFMVDVEAHGEFIVSIHQTDRRCHGAKEYMDVGVTVMKADPTYGTFTFVAGTGNSVERQNSSEIFELDAGKYMIVPTTTGIKLKEYLIKQRDDPANAARNAAAAMTPLVVENDDGEMVFTEPVIQAYSELFDRMDHNNDGYLCRTELDQYMMRTEGAPVQESAFQWLVSKFESADAPGLSKTGFLRAQQFVFQHTGADEEKLRNEFKILGYNANMEFESGRPAVLSVHGTANYSLETMVFDPAAYEEAVELPVKCKGEVTSFEDGKINLYRHRSGYCGVSFVVENKHTAPLVFVLDMSSSKNVVTHRRSLKFQKTIPPNEAKVMHHILPDNSEAGDWSWGYSASYMFKDE
mmetsp:Transcript_6717/g.11290  ORF Transcript_6717/g.11290 Transcript_6717/m.11290 type:complete len:845 (-) Transcript_6717:102-2636(-)